MQLSFNKFAHQIKEYPLLRQGFFLAAALASIAIVGYHFGTFDQSVHIPFLKATADPSLFPKDPFLDLRTDQFSFFWDFFLPFYKSGVLEPMMFLVHLLVTTLFFQSVWDLSMTLFGEPMAALFTVLSFVVAHTGFVGFPVIEFSLLSRTFVLPFLLFAVNHYLRRQYGVAFLILGLAYNLNLLMTNFVLVMLIFSSLVDIRRIGWRRLAICLGLFLLGALPVLIWKIRSGTGFDLSLRSEWFTAITQGALYQIFYLFSASPFFLLTLGGFSSIALFCIARRYNPSSAHNNQMTHFMVALITILVVQIITTVWAPITLIIQMQISRASLFILIFAYFYFAGYLANEYLSGKISGGNMILISGCLFFSVSPVFPLLAWAVYKKYPSLLMKRSYAAVMILVVMTTLYSLGFMALKLWKPGIKIYAGPSAWIDIQNWARKNTAKDAIFITPPYEVGLYQPDWRVFSERETIATMYDLFEIALKPEYFKSWKARFESLAPGAMDEFEGNFFKNQTITRNAYNSLGEDDLLKIACKYDADYLVSEKNNVFGMPAVYENEEYRIYSLKNKLDCFLMN
jgi:hypothetical protein